MIEEKSIKTKYSEDIETVYTYGVTKQCQNNIVEYGIEVRREDKSKGDIIKLVKNQVESVSSSKERIEELVNLLCRNEVSPIHLKDILCDYIDRYVS